jgi:hypothetical protein
MDVEVTVVCAMPELFIKEAPATIKKAATTAAKFGAVHFQLFRDRIP